MRYADVYSAAALSCWVYRCHTWPVIRRQTTGHHSARVAQIYCEIFGLPRAEVLYYALHHDSGELFAGDSPASAKWECPELKAASDVAEKTGLDRLGVVLPQLSGLEWQRVKICDSLELWEYACGELCMGNKFARQIVNVCRRVSLEKAASADGVTPGASDTDAVEAWIIKEEARYARA